MRPEVLTADDIMTGNIPVGPVLVFDDELYYMGGVIAEKLQRAGVETILATTSAMISPWTENTDEQHLIQARLIELGVRLETSTVLVTDTTGLIVYVEPSDYRLAVEGGRVRIDIAIT